MEWLVLHQEAVAQQLTCLYALHVYHMNHLTFFGNRLTKKEVSDSHNQMNANYEVRVDVMDEWFNSGRSTMAAKIILKTDSCFPLVLIHMSDICRELLSTH
jgi:isoleucyl-tRNA synthetase